MQWQHEVLTDEVGFVSNSLSLATLDSSLREGAFKSLPLWGRCPEGTDEVDIMGDHIGSPLQLYKNKEQAA